MLTLENLIISATKSKKINEANTKQSIITPLLALLGWNINNPEEVKLELETEKGKVDYALIYNNKVKVLIEAKKNYNRVENYDNQIRKYSTGMGDVNLFILTNGIQWVFYTWHREYLLNFLASNLKKKNLQL